MEEIIEVTNAVSKKTELINTSYIVNVFEGRDGLTVVVLNYPEGIDLDSLIKIKESVSFIKKMIIKDSRPVKENSNNQNKLLNEDEICQVLGVCRTTMFLWRKKGKIPFYRIGGRYRYRLSEILDSIKK